MSVLEILKKNKRVDEVRQAALKALVIGNKKPIISVSSWSYSDKFTFGDLEDLGYAYKEYIRDSNGEVEFIDWYYTGPNPIWATFRRDQRPFEVISGKVQIN